ncbi:TetR/AcrR family transcriptional regulator [Symbioplanes lichenis]|uniref:TetR/AcrR family transcriptional regulator n=1 Tax=Symbioplanes lichenis TaxID=1629072 RepID=UPI0027387E34|nr:TetR family transcriptional regulator [Actinoplanes lichenis]
MGRVSKVQAEANRQRVVETAARLFRERGIAGVSVADLMAEAGLTHGGFYKQFASKEALVTEALQQAFTEAQLPAEGSDDAARAAYMERYLSAQHRDHPATGCPCAGFGGDLARGPQDAVRTYAEGVEAYARALGPGGEGDLAAVSTLVGAMILARATRGTDVSDRILAAAREALLRP